MRVRIDDYCDLVASLIECFELCQYLSSRSRDFTLQGWIVASACLHDVEFASARRRRWKLTRVSIFVVAVGSVNGETYANICSTSNHVSSWSCYFRSTKPWWLRSVFLFVWFSVSSFFWRSLKHSKLEIILSLWAIFAKNIPESLPGEHLEARYVWKRHPPLKKREQFLLWKGKKQRWTTKVLKKLYGNRTSARDDHHSFLVLATGSSCDVTLGEPHKQSAGPSPWSSQV